MNNQNKHVKERIFTLLLLLCKKLSEILKKEQNRKKRL